MQKVIDIRINDSSKFCGEKKFMPTFLSRFFCSPIIQMINEPVVRFSSIQFCCFVRFYDWVGYILFCCSCIDAMAIEHAPDNLQCHYDERAWFVLWESYGSKYFPISNQWVLHILRFIWSNKCITISMMSTNICMLDDNCNDE